MKMTIRFVCSHLRKDLSKKAPKPIKRSKYCQYLWDKATFKECDE